ncbi:MAG: hypothetical protein AABY22_08605, partial [Nanoarchaeota archaeon]
GFQPIYCYKPGDIVEWIDKLNDAYEKSLLSPVPKAPDKMWDFLLRIRLENLNNIPNPFYKSLERLWDNEKDKIWDTL